MSNDGQSGVVTTCAGADLNAADLAACVAIVSEGRAVNPASARDELPRSLLVAVVRAEDAIVGVGAIKRARPPYAKKRAKLAGQEFPPETPELGYVAVASAHRGQAWSSKIVDKLLAAHAGPLWATTDDERMKHLLQKAGFVRRGKEWDGKRGRLSLWLKGIEAAG